MVEYSVDSTDVNTVPEGSRADHVEARNSDVFRLLLMCSISIIDYWVVCPINLSHRGHLFKSSYNQGIRYNRTHTFGLSGCRFVAKKIK